MKPNHLLIGTVLVAVLGAAYGPAVMHGVVDGLAYCNAGLGPGAAIAMAFRPGDYTLRLGFSTGRQNARLADVKLDIFDAEARPVFALAEAGPVVDVQLPAGRYRVVAESGGVRRQGTVSVEAKRLSELYLHWSTEPDA